MHDYEWGSGQEDSAWSTEPLHTIYWSLDSVERFDEEISSPEDVYLALFRDAELMIGIVLREFDRDHDPFEPWTDLELFLSSWAQTRGASLASLTSDESEIARWDARFRIPLRGRTVRDAHEFGLQAIAIARAYVDGVPTLESLVALLRSGQGAALVGLHESQILECKRTLNVGTERDELEFAKDIAALANSETGGVVVIGMSTKRDRSGDRIASAHPLSPDITSRRVRGIIDRRSYPPIDGLAVESVASGSAHVGELLSCFVPPQPQELKPFLVHGAIAGGRVMGAFISIPRRRGEDTIQTSPASIHSFLVAGRALLRESRSTGLRG